jgi:hypothetical protein
MTKLKIIKIDPSKITIEELEDETCLATIEDVDIEIDGQTYSGDIEVNDISLPHNGDDGCNLFSQIFSDCSQFIYEELEIFTYEDSFKRDDLDLVCKIINDEAIKMDKAGEMTDWCIWLCGNYLEFIEAFDLTDQPHSDVSDSERQRVSYQRGEHYKAAVMKQVMSIKNFEREHNCSIKNEFKSKFEKHWDNEEELEEMIEDIINKQLYKG